MNSEQYIEVSILLDPFSEEQAEILTAELSELPYEAFVTEEPYLKCYIQKEHYRPSDVKVVLSGYPVAAGFNAVLVQGQNWNKAWEERFEPIVVDGTVTVKAPFNTDVPRTRYNIWIDPQMAFGTGYHHTTYMMMQRMLRLPVRGASVVDMGCGTAILAILAAKMGARKVFAVDIDAVAARSAWGNCRWNRVGTRVETACGDASLLQMSTYDVLLANIHRNIILQDLPTYVRSLKRHGHLLLSGFYEADIPALTTAATALGLQPAGPAIGSAPSSAPSSASGSASGSAIAASAPVGLSLRDGWACLEFLKP
ncbi:MAG: 50S ribosomal protein L11 methyltransferase [Bacteroidales bacterium]|nr:50S ribosomal protein L11 methyltransferase [Bacteroidales bacterium]